MTILTVIYLTKKKKNLNFLLKKHQLNIINNKIKVVTSLKILFLLIQLRRLKKLGIAFTFKYPILKLKKSTYSNK